MVGLRSLPWRFFERLVEQGAKAEAGAVGGRCVQT